MRPPRVRPVPPRGTRDVLAPFSPGAANRSGPARRPPAATHFPRCRTPNSARWPAANLVRAVPRPLVGVACVVDVRLQRLVDEHAGRGPGPRRVPGRALAGVASRRALEASSRLGGVRARGGNGDPRGVRARQRCGGGCVLRRDARLHRGVHLRAARRASRPTSSATRGPASPGGGGSSSGRLLLRLRGPSPATMSGALGPVSAARRLSPAGRRNDSSAPSGPPTRSYRSRLVRAPRPRTPGSRSSTGGYATHGALRV